LWFNAVTDSQQEARTPVHVPIPSSSPPPFCLVPYVHLHKRLSFKHTTLWVVPCLWGVTLPGII
jgi:hypothetical protein